MSLLREAERCLERQHVYRALNAFIAPTAAAQRGPLLRSVADIEDHNIRAPGKANVAGRLIGIKDNIATVDFPTTCGSRILHDYISPFDATVVTQLREAGAKVAGKTNLDEFGMGSHSIYSSFGPVLNGSTHDSGRGKETDERSAGGSSGGSAVAVATGQCHAALGTDTGGSVRLPAAYTGIVGFKPTYGLLSRHGVVAYANSLDTVGILARDIASTSDVFSTLNAHDPRDPTSLAPTTRTRIAPRPRKRPLRIGFPIEYNINELSTTVRKAWTRTLVALNRLKTIKSVQGIHLPTTRHALPAYYVLALAEASSNLARFDTVRFGPGRPSSIPHDLEGGTLFAAARGRLLGAEVQRRILLGSYSLSAAARDNYFLQAQRVRRLVQRDFDAVFAASNPLLDPFETLQIDVDSTADENGADVLVAPTAPTLPPTLRELESRSSLDEYTNDVFTVPASLAGLPAVSVPVRVGDEERGETVGIQVIGQFGDDELVLRVGEMVEGLVGIETSP